MKGLFNTEEAPWMVMIDAKVSRGTDNDKKLAKPKHKVLIDIVPYLPAVSSLFVSSFPSGQDLRERTPLASSL